MDKNAIWKWLILIILVMGSLALVTPPSKKIPLGLDLQGGTSFLVSVDEQRVREGVKDKDEKLTPEQAEPEVQRILKDAQSRALEVLRNRVDSLGIAEPIIYPTKDNRIVIQLPGVDKSRQELQNIQRELDASLTLVHPLAAASNAPASAEIDLKAIALLITHLDEADKVVLRLTQGVQETGVYAGFSRQVSQMADETIRKARAQCDALQAAKEPAERTTLLGDITLKLETARKDVRAMIAKRVKDVEVAITSAAFLEFRMVHKNNSKLVDDLFRKELAPDGYRIVRIGNGTYYARNADTEETLDEATRSRLGRWQVPDSEYEFMLEKVDEQGQKVLRPVFVKRRAEMTGDLLKSSAIDYGPMGSPIVDLTFNNEGAKIFRDLTTDYAPGGDKNPNRQNYRQLAVVLDGTLYSAPRIDEPIPNGRAVIKGSFSLQEATLLSNILNAGSLPAPVKIIERRIVDPTLGKDSISSGVRAGLYGCISILILMAAYYMMSGLLADVTLVLNVVLLPLGAVAVAGFLGLIFGGLQGSRALSLPVLTLPGIAGITLAVGMAVDANVLIFERMREELRTGKGFKAAVDAGFTRAFTAIFDSNMTTIITAVIMFAVGTGAVRGYAITLTAGLLINLYTAVFVARLFFNTIGSRTIDTKWLKMHSVIKETNFDFMRLWKVAFAVSIALIAVSWTLMFMHGTKDRTTVFGVDFTGGTSLSMSFDQKPSVEAIRTSLAAGGVRDNMIQYQGALEGGSKEILLVKVATTKEAEVALTTLAEKFPQANFEVLQRDDVGPQVGRELKTRGFWALALAMIAMVVYIGFRFEFGFGLGAVVATVHDAAMVIGICHLFGFQLNMTIMAAVLTIIGYSVNDTIVIFDRIRENLRLVRGKTFKDICNLSVNQTLARTLLTNFFTFMSVLFLLLMGGGAIKDFSFAMFVGMIAGTYSTVYIATPILLMWYRGKTPDLGSKTTGT